MLRMKLLTLLALVQTSTTNLPEECLTSGPGPPQTNRTKVMLGYLTDVTGMPGRQVRPERERERVISSERPRASSLVTLEVH